MWGHTWPPTIVDNWEGEVGFPKVKEREGSGATRWQKVENKFWSKCSLIHKCHARKSDTPGIYRAYVGGWCEFTLWQVTETTCLSEPRGTAVTLHTLANTPDDSVSNVASSPSGSHYPCTSSLWRCRRCPLSLTWLRGLLRWRSCSCIELGVTSPPQFYVLLFTVEGKHPLDLLRWRIYVLLFTVEGKHPLDLLTVIRFL